MVFGAGVADRRLWVMARGAGECVACPVMGSCLLGSVEDEPTQ